MWELAFIARDYTVRRQSIFEDIDRKDGPLWSQIYAICLDTIKELERRIDGYGKPPTPAAGTEPLPASMQPRERISQPLKSDDVSAPRSVARASLVKDTVAKLVTSPGKTPAQNWVPGLKKRAIKVADQVMTPQQREVLQPKALLGWFGTISLRVLALPMIGPAFQRTFGRQLVKAVLGSPYAEISIYVNAAYALSHLAVCSLTEDKYGNVQRDVPAIIRTFTVVIKKFERFRDEFPTHWTDLSQDRQCPEASEVLTALKDGLGVLVTAFSPYSSDLRLSRADMRLAREALEKSGEDAEARQGEVRQPEMQQMS
jgi:nucleoporin NDC1